MAFLFFLILFLVSLGGIFILLGRHIAAVRNLSAEEADQFVSGTLSPFQEIKNDFLIPFERWLKHTSSFLLFHIGEWSTRYIRKGFMYAEIHVKRLNDYLHGRKIVMRKKGQSPFWDSMHEWKDEMKNGNGDTKNL